MSSHAFAKAALAYPERLGWAVFPCRGKIPAIPAIKGGHGCLDATTDRAQVEEWWQEYPDANIGIATGAASGFWVVDIDGDLGEESLDELVRARGPLPETIEALTGGGGRHLLFRYIEEIGNCAGVAAGIDVRGDGGYIVAPPSLHPTGRRYCWEVDHRPLEVPLAEAPGWLDDLVRDRGGGRSQLADAAAPDRPAWLATACGAVPQGHRNDVLARVAGHLLRRCDPQLAAAVCLDWNIAHCRPPLPETEVRRTIDSIAGAELRRLRGRT